MEDENMAEANHEVPMKVSAQGRTHLKELSQASSNSKSLIPQLQTLKSRPKSTPQTLEPKRTASASTSRPASTTRGHNRVNTITASSSFAAHRAPTSSSSRMPANKSLSSTVGPGTRPPSMKRPHSAASEPRKKVPPGVARPVTAFDTHDEGNNGSGIKNRKGRRSSLPFSFQAFPPTFSAGGHGGSFRDSTGIRALFSRGAIPEDSDCEELSSCISPRNSTLSPSPGRITDPKTPVISQNGPQKSFSSVNPKSSTSRRQAYKRQTSVPQKHSSQSRTHVPFLNKYSSVKAFNYSTGDEWDVNTKTKTMEGIVEALFSRMNQAGESSSGLKEAMELYKSQVNELKASNGHLMEANLSFRVEVETMRTRLAAAENTLKETERSQDIAMDDAERRYRFDLENARQRNMKELEESDSRHQDELRELKRRFERELDDEKAVRQREANQAQSQYAVGAQRLQVEVEQKDREIFRLQDDLKALREDMERERKKNLDLRQNLDTASNSSVTLESSIRALKARIEFLESGREEQSQSFERINQQMLNALSETNETKEKLRKEETLRRKLHNQVQELKGNIRVFCRVRPSLDHEPATGAAQFQYPDQSAEAKEICIQGPEERNSFGAVTRKNNFFSFDRVFEPLTQNAEVFDEISQLVQSALDGYNVCIFCYGQTGSGKTYTMSSPDGMIPRTVLQIYDTAKSLEDKGWTYTMEGNFVEVYNENLNDLLGSPEEMDKKKHEIRHDMQTCKTTITGATTVRLDSPEMVESILRRAATNRTVAATRVNERSSRSHSVFILKLIGHNAFTGERSEGTLNLVDLAGSERLSQSGVTGERLKETQNINRSLSCLGDVIAALGQGKEGGHIPYRNSKLTYLLQFSLGGNSKTLMFVMVSPLQNHLSETLTSLKFATKVHHTHIGTAKRQTRVRDA